MESTLTKFPYNMYRKYTTQEAWKLKTKQDAPSIQLLPHILHEIARTYVYAIELSIHTTISTRKSYSLFLLRFKFILLQISIEISFDYHEIRMCLRKPNEFKNHQMKNFRKILNQ